MDGSNSVLWNQLADQAHAGELYIADEQVALDFGKACDQYILELERMRVDAEDTQNVAGFGDFPMASALVDKYTTQATGTDTSVDAVIIEHIEVVKNMREVMKISYTRITGQEWENTAAITKAGQGR